MEAKKKIKSASEMTVVIGLELTEEEARALNAITSYGANSFLEAFYEKLGRAYLEKYERGIHSLFATIKQELPPHLGKCDDARNIWRNE